MDPQTQIPEEVTPPSPVTSPSTLSTTISSNMTIISMNNHFLSFFKFFRICLLLIGVNMMIAKYIYDSTRKTSGAAHEDIVVRAESFQDGSSSPQPVSQVYLPPGLSAHGERWRTIPGYLEGCGGKLKSSLPDKGEVIVQTQFSHAWNFRAIVAWLETRDENYCLGLAVGWQLLIG